MPMKIGINGFGRIGRQVLRIAYEQKGVEVVHINDVSDTETLAYLLQSDTTYGRWAHQVRAEGDRLVIDDGTTITVSAEKDPAQLPWGEKGAEVVLEATGLFRKKEDAHKHIEAGARKVLISAPGKSELDGDFILGVNGDQFDRDQHHIISIGSCTTNCLAPVVKVLHDEFGIEKGFINTVHAYTSSQNLLDGPHKKPRRGRAAAENLVPTSTGAAAMIGQIIPDLDGRLDGIAVRAPVKAGSLLDLTCLLAADADGERINDAFRERANGSMKGILAVDDSPLVSSDIIGREESAIVTSQDTQLIGDRFIKLLAWYDNEWAFSRRCVDMMQRMA
ncbi:type I glyceraldehyde-3-phosphate dehydrogenase [Marinobacter vulgaris]|uniref:Type I glyceraldehyde-3-phosphate dehydrogenase n=2 Tax=Marinobacter vulgaris TaxID=1928331 RepID=A0A2V3ZJ44_9GAMM|nr:type I glyceraldehyde-3-phosphate dehydrogenase [Marinobacter vulgaris]TSJ70207.1 type I glyceraldehyde-3-phosphate dehydrogenase [Marinobacter vulgaris]